MNSYPYLNRQQTFELATMPAFIYFVVVLLSVVSASSERAPLGAPNCKPKQLMWFLCLSKNSRLDHKKHAAVAVVSAKKHAPSLIPHLMWVQAAAASLRY